jgi:hypothetical protein
MKKNTLATALTGLGLLVSAPAWADLNYYDLNQGKSIKDLTAAGKALLGNDLPINNPTYWNDTYQSGTTQGETWTILGGSFASGTWGYQLWVASLDSSGWTDGLRTNPKGGAKLLGDTHMLGFANFHLAGNSTVTITLTDDPALVGSGYGLNPSFSLYRGSAVYQVHDDVAVDPMNPKAGVPPKKTQNAKDTGSVVDSQGITSAYRVTTDDTTIGTVGAYVGQFNAQGGWSAGNTAGYWSALDYVASATGYANPDGSWSGNANSNTMTIDLSAGDYTIAFGGNAQPLSYTTVRSADATSSYGVVTGYSATLNFNVVAAPVPEPGTWAMLLAGLGLVGVAVRRRA